MIQITIKTGDKQLLLFLRKGRSHFFQHFALVFPRQPRDGAHFDERDNVQCTVRIRKNRHGVLCPISCIFFIPFVRWIAFEIRETGNEWDIEISVT